MLETGNSQPVSGDLYREYVWLPTMVKEQEKFLRVGGKLDYKTATDHMPSHEHDQGRLPLRQSVDLEQAIRAEITLELVQSHEDTKGLSLEINDNEWIPVPDMINIPRPQSDYMIHTYPTFEVPLENLHEGAKNWFSLNVDPEQKWNWPQNLIYGIIFRIYYDPVKVDPYPIRIGGVNEGEKVRDQQRIFLEDFPAGELVSVDFYGRYLDFNWEGDGIYNRWHGHFHKGELRNHLGTAGSPPYEVIWNTAWIPDQPDGMAIRARVKYKNGMYRITQVVDDLSLSRNYSIELCRPYNQPKNWVTRQDTLLASFPVHGPLKDAVGYQVGWRSWSPCYGRGLFINDEIIWQQEEPCYGYAEHLIERQTTTNLHLGENQIKTGMTPLIEGKMVHGMEVQYPGIMVKIRYSVPSSPEIRISEGVYEGRKHLIINTPTAIYYYDQRGGGFSRMLDPDGVDWINFKKEPWNEYPASAASAYRGIPNLVYGSSEGGAGHPGHDRCTTEIIDSHTIRTQSLTGKWVWQWEFFNDHAKLSILKADPDHPYWFLYEGTPGGTFNPAFQYFGNNTGGPFFENPDYIKGEKIFQQWRWFYCGTKLSRYSIYLAQMDSDPLSDIFSYMGNSESGIKSYDGMVVFGFGRAEGAKPLIDKPKEFIIGFYAQEITSQKEHREIEKYIQKLID